MKRLKVFTVIFLVCVASQSYALEQGVLINAFGETATAYLNDSFLLIGTTADGFVADIIQKDTALEITKNVQRRLRIIRAKIKMIDSPKLSLMDKKLISLLNDSFLCMDHQAWALMRYIQEKVPENAKKFESHRSECLGRIKKVAEFYSEFPTPVELPAPLSTR
ncbi:MAG: hypothetical protein PHS86_03585 [Syntrophaceae bacterium]|nr:hypothetical protein [Syntrophaceae bacterium]